MSLRKITKIKRYIFNQIDHRLYVFLQYPKEGEKLLIQAYKISANLFEGDIVCISKTGSDYVIEFTEVETEIIQEKVSSLLDKLKNKK